MGLFNFIRSADINTGVETCRKTQGAVMLDVRTEEEYCSGHIEGSVNVPLDQLVSVPGIVKDKNTPLFVYCYSGSRSSRAVALLKQMGYPNVTNIGGIQHYRGRTVR